jgi:hypothetical protein
VREGGRWGGFHCRNVKRKVNQVLNSLGTGGLLIYRKLPFLNLRSNVHKDYNTAFTVTLKE